jgi:hypothetical protein
MPYAQRDEFGDIVALYAQPQPHLVPPATEWVPEGTTITEKEPDRVKRELVDLVKTYPLREQESVKPVENQIFGYIDQGKLTEACAVVDNIGSMPVVPPPHKTEMKNKIMEAAP